ncbi:RNA1 polyprotein [Bienertia sinuspersici]
MLMLEFLLCLALEGSMNFPVMSRERKRKGRQRE